MIDWLTLKLEVARPDGSQVLTREQVEQLRALHGRVMGISSDGDIEWETSRWESIRSDSHRLAVRFTDSLWIQGSPARVGQRHNVFGSIDIQECAARMIAFASQQLGLPLPMSLELWECRRVDVTFNYDLGNLATVKQALLSLKQSEGGHYQTSAHAESIYWNKSSRLRSGKAYAKGPHLRYQLKRGDVELPAEHFDLADRLLRLELKIGSQFMRERLVVPWYRLEPDLLEEMHNAYFAPLIGNLRVTEMSETALMDKVIKTAPTPGLGRSAWGTYCRIRQEGYRNVQETMNRSSYFRHRKILLEAGISLAQLQSATITPLVRKRAIEIGKPVFSFEELAARVA